jgi:hypothetical protein
MHTAPQWSCPTGQPHPPEVHTSVIAQACPQSPQFITSVFVFASQPFAGLRSQSWKPALHDVSVHTPVMQPPVPFMTLHAIMQPPQLVVLVFVLASQPLVAMPSQSPKPVLQRIEQTPAVQAAVPLIDTHVVVHVPQWSGSVDVFTHVPVQHDAPNGHACVALHPGTQLPPVQMLPTLQSVSAVHPVQRWNVVSHVSMRVVPETRQSASLAHPARHCRVGVQKYPCAHW